MPGTHHWYTTGPARHRGSTSEATVVHRWCWQALKQHNTLTLGSLTKDTLKRDNLNPYDRANVLEQLCDCTKYYRRHESGC